MDKLIKDHEADFKALCPEAMDWIASAVIDDHEHEAIDEIFAGFTRQYIDRCSDLDFNPRYTMLIMLPKIVDILYNTISAGMGEEEAEKLIDITYMLGKAKAQAYFAKNGDRLTEQANSE